MTYETLCLLHTVKLYSKRESLLQYQITSHSKTHLRRFCKPCLLEFRLKIALDISLSSVALFTELVELKESFSALWNLCIPVCLSQLHTNSTLPVSTFPTSCPHHCLVKISNEIHTMLSPLWVTCFSHSLPSPLLCSPLLPLLLCLVSACGSHWETSGCSSTSSPPPLLELCEVMWLLLGEL